MARGGINRAIVQIARDALIARGVNPSINAVRVELGNTGSMTTIARYLGELEKVEPRPNERRERLSDELSGLVGQLLGRLLEEGAEEIAEARAELDKHRASVNEQLAQAQAALAELQRQHDNLQAALDVQAGELSTCQSSLQSELTRNARLSQNCADLEVRVHEKDEQIRSLEEKHLHARDALEHYRTAMKDQREQEQRRHEGQLQQIQVEHRQLQQTLSVKQDELSRLNRDNERLLSESRQQTKVMATQDGTISRLTADLNTLAIASAREEGAKEQLIDQLAHSREESASLRESATQAETRAKNAQVLLETSQYEVDQLRQKLHQLSHEKKSITE
ncbi:Chromosome partition protein Smc [Pseudomonas fluorescens]|uniref:Chromosome partition protein Smc n=1 Tax=Pseudomonas fluorescens TaxID=294 RepID=A0A5E7SGT3_PSEFL|nr:DNA-binding protein [Pseudomonas fluorescens]VVP84857.1 Chromosome partition protein Smc [Pseudomonas fluorescens]